MTKKSLRVWLVLLSLFLVLANLAALSPRNVAQAASCPTGDFMPSITQVQPGKIVNDIDHTLTITGSGFEEGIIVLVDGFGALATTCVNANVITAVVPAGISGKSGGKDYDITVINPTLPDTNTDTFLDALTVFKQQPTAEAAPTATPQPTAFVRPLLTVQSYGASLPTLRSNQNIDFEMTLQNLGQLPATNVVVTFAAGDLIPRATGGVVALGTIDPGQTNRFFQPFVTSSLSGDIATLDVSVSYTTSQGTEYSESFKLTFPAVAAGSGVSPTATPTPLPQNRPQLVISGYKTDLDRLLPGASFVLALDVQNLGTQDAQSITLIAGGGSVSDGAGEGTPQPGGVSGGEGEFTNFAPVGTSNIQVLGDLVAGHSLSASQRLVVNVSTEPGAYPFRVSFTYTDREGRRYVDEQVITLLVYSTLQVDISFYRDPNPIFAGQPSPLPLQVINLGKTGAVLGNLVVTAEGADLTNNIILVGRLDPGGYFTTDATLIPFQPGQLDVAVSILYTDDFNQAQQITQTLTLDVLEAPPVEDFGSEGLPPTDVPLAPPETFLQKVWRFIRGLLGLDSAPASGPGGEEFFPPGGGGGEIPPSSSGMKGP